MARSSPSTDAVMTMLRDLIEAEALAGSLVGTAPGAVSRAGGAQALVAHFGRRTGAWFWSIAPVPDALWEDMAGEHQAPHRASLGED